MPSVWDHKSDKDLLLTIIDEGSLKSIIWTSIASKMQARGYSFSHEACRQHFQKLRKESKNSSASSATSSPVKATPTKRKATKSASSSKTSSFKSGNGVFGEYFDNGDDEEEVGGGGKRVKKEENGVYGQKVTLFKMERDSHFVDLENDDLYDEA